MTQLQPDSMVSDYISYLSGVSWLHNPEATRAAHTYNPHEEPDTLVCRAYEQMRESCQRLLRRSNGVTSLAETEGKLERVDGLLRAVVQTTFNTPASVARVRLLLPKEDRTLETIQPAPFLERITYSYLAKGRSSDKLTTRMLMGGVAFHKDIELHQDAPQIRD